MGKKFGNMLAEALKIPSHALDQLTGGINWVLDKLGIIDTKSDGLKDKVPSPDAYGMMPFMRQPLPYGDMQQNINCRWPTNSRFGQRPSAQFIGPGDEIITLSGELRPEITGGSVSLMTVRLMADEGMAWPLIGGSGMIYGMYVIESISNTFR